MAAAASREGGVEISRRCVQRSSGVIDRSRIRRRNTRWDYSIRACYILPDHVHLVVDRHERMAEKIAGHLKSAASLQLRADGLHPLMEHLDPAMDRIPTPWAERCWKCFLNDEESIQQAIQYVQDNPIKDGKRPQRWPFVRPFYV